MPPFGNHANLSEKTKINPRAIQKYGTADRKVRIGGIAVSNSEPRHHAARIPISVPMKKLISREMPTRPIVQGKLCARIDVTCVGYCEDEIPRWPVSTDDR